MKRMLWVLVLAPMGVLAQTRGAPPPPGLTAVDAGTGGLGTGGSSTYGTMPLPPGVFGYDAGLP
jgi:hypothetical protein